MQPDIVIVGSGIIGSALARELAGNQARVLLLDRKQPVSEASWAAAGMLAPAAEATHLPALVPLSRASLDLYPAFVEAIEAESGMRVGLRRSGTLQVFFGTRGDEARKEYAAALARLRMTAQPLTGEEVRQREPGLSPEASAGLWLGDEASVDNRTLARATVLAAQRRGAELRSGVEVSGLAMERDRCVGVLAGGEKIAAGQVVIASGCFSARIERVGRYAPTRPARGQMVALNAGTARPATVLRCEHGYLVPREDGRVLAGSTLEDAGFDKSVTPQGLRKVLDAAVEMVPALNTAPILETWSGLRPDTPDHLPILGPTEIQGLSVATGHYRDGILLAPVTARLARQWLLGQKTDLPLDAFSPMRFAKAASA